MARFGCLQAVNLGKFFDAREIAVEWEPAAASEAAKRGLVVDRQLSAAQIIDDVLVCSHYSWIHIEY